MRLIHAETAAGTAVSNTTTETAICTKTFAANHFTSGKVIKFAIGARATATNSTDTLLFKVYFGGTAIFTGTAVDVANADVAVMTGEIIVRDADASGTAVCLTRGVNCDATQTLNTSDALTIVSSLDFTGSIVLTCKATWSVASASNSCQSEYFTIFEAV